MWASLIGLVPPGFRRVGSIRHFFDKPQVASVILEASATIHRGDFLLIRLANRYFGQEIDSMQEDGADIAEATGGVVGVKTSLRRSDVGVGDIVYVRDQRATHAATDSDMPERTS